MLFSSKFKVELVTWGKSVGISLPKPIRDNLNLKAGDEVEIVDNEKGVTIRKLKLEKSIVKVSR